MAVNEDYVRERLTAYIYPRAPATDAQNSEFEAAVEAQVAYETENMDGEAIPGNVESFSIGNYSVNFAEAGSAQYTRRTISPAAYAFLFNAGLICHDLPTARRL